MGEEKEAEFYTGKGYTDKAIQRYMPIYTKVIELLSNCYKSGRIVEFGSGVGVLAKMLHDVGYTSYLGIDFSPSMLALSKKRAQHQSFLQLDLRDDAPSFYTGCQYFIALETLEHIKEDLRVLGNIPKGAHVIFSVPTYNFKAHVRYFKTQEEVRAHYDASIQIEFCELISKIWVCKGRKK